MEAVKFSRGLLKLRLKEESDRRGDCQRISLVSDLENPHSMLEELRKEVTEGSDK